MTGTVWATVIVGLAMTMIATSAFCFVTGRAPSLAFEDGDNNAVSGAIFFRIFAGPGILLLDQLSRFTSGKASVACLAYAAVGFAWAGSYGAAFAALA